jgi:hypothetical protein
MTTIRRDVLSSYKGDVWPSLQGFPQERINAHRTFRRISLIEIYAKVPSHEGVQSTPQRLWQKTPATGKMSR